MVSASQDHSNTGCRLLSCRHDIISIALRCFRRFASTTWPGIVHTEASADTIIKDLNGLRLLKQSSKSILLLRPSCHDTCMVRNSQCVEFSAIMQILFLASSAIPCC